jgi:hypothetical protein
MVLPADQGVRLEALAVQREVPAVILVGAEGRSEAVEALQAEVAGYRSAQFSAVRIPAQHLCRESYLAF